MEIISLNNNTLSKETKFIGQRRDVIFSVLKYITFNQLIPMQFLNRDFYYNIIPKLFAKMNFRTFSEKEINIHPVKMTKLNNIEFYYGRFFHVDKIFIAGLNVNWGFLEILKILVRNNRNNLNSLSLFDNNFLMNVILSKENVYYSDDDRKMILDGFIETIFQLKLENLEIFSSFIVEEGIDLVKSIIRKCDETGINFFENLKTLNLGRLSLDDLCLILEKCNYSILEVLSIERCNITHNLEKTFECISKFKNLKSFKVNDTFNNILYAEFFISSLVSLSNIVEEIILDGCEFLISTTNNEFKVNSFNPLLKQNDILNLKSISNIEIFVKYFLHENLKILRLSLCKIEDKKLTEYILPFLNKCSNLKVISLDFNKITHVGLELLLQSLANSYSTLEEINLSNNLITNKGLKLISTFLENNMNLVGMPLAVMTLYKCSISFDDEGISLMSSIITAIIKSRKHFHLIISQNDTSNYLKLIEGLKINLDDQNLILNTDSFHAINITCKLNPKLMKDENNLELIKHLMVKYRINIY